MRTRIVAGLLWLICAGASGAAQTRVALVSGERGAEVVNVLSLASAKLSSDAEIEMLERDEVRRVLDEQKLSLSGVVDASKAVAAGKLLSVDLFAVVEAQSGEKGAMGLVIFDARNGVRYWDAALPGGVPEQAENAAAAGVQTAARKQRQLTHGLRTIGLLTVRNADLPRSQDGVCESVGLLLERGLPRSPDVAVLERRRLEHVNAERSLPGAESASGLLASLVTVELEIARGADARGLKATALLSDGRGKVPRKISAEVTEPKAPLLADALLQKLIEALEAAPADATPDRLIEAKRFDREANHHHDHGQFTDAARAQEAACALDPASNEYNARLAFYLVRYATYLFSPAEINSSRGSDDWGNFKVTTATLETLLGRASRGVEISSDLLRKGLRDMWGHLTKFDYPMERLCHRLHGLRKTAPASDREQIDVFFNLCRGRSLDFIERSAVKAETDPRELDHYTAIFQSQRDEIKAACIDTAQYAGEMHRCTARWLAITKDWQPKFCSWNGAEAFNMLMAAIVNESRYARWPWPVDEREYARTMEPLFVLMRNHPRPSVKLYGLLGQIRADVLLGRTSEEAACARFSEEYRPLAQSIITTPEPWHASRTREEAYEAWRSAMGEMPGKEKRAFAAREFGELGEFLLSRNELRYKVVESILDALEPAPALKMTRRMSAVINSATLDDPGIKNTIRSHLNTVEQKILTAHPELATGRPGAPWSKAMKIFDVGEFRQLSDIVAPVIAGDVVYAFAFEFEAERSALRLLRIPLTGGSTSLLAKVDLDRPPKSLKSWERQHFIPSAGIDGDLVYAATRGAGIVLFPLNGGAPRRIDTRAGLPADEVSSAAILDEKLYAGVGEGYMIRCDLESNRCEVVASSRRKEKRSPFDDREAFQIPWMLRDAERGRIVFLIDKALWQVTPADGRFTQVLDLLAVQNDRSDPKIEASTLTWASPLRGDRALLSTPFRAVEIDLRRNSATAIHSPDRGVFQMWPPHLVVNDSLWSADYFARLALKEHTQERLPPLDGTGSHYRPMQCLELVAGGRQVLVGDERTLWLLDLKTNVDTSP